VNPWEDASGGKAVTCGESKCIAEWTYSGAAGRFDVAVEYFDLPGGAAKFVFAVNGPAANANASWAADAVLPSRQPHGDNSTRHIARGVALKPGDVIRIEGTPDGLDVAALDYIEVQPAR
jgi:alpha-glucuronidase